jgi:hypothetical protein
MICTKDDFDCKYYFESNIDVQQLLIQNNHIDITDTDYTLHIEPNKKQTVDSYLWQHFLTIGRYQVRKYRFLDGSDIFQNPEYSKNEFNYKLFFEKNEGVRQTLYKLNVISLSQLDNPLTAYDSISSDSIKKAEIDNIIWQYWNIRGQGNLNEFDFSGNDFPLDKRSAVISPISPSVVQNSITITATTTNPSFGSKTIEQVNYQLIYDKFKICYRFAWSGGSLGLGQYLIHLPSGISFNTLKNPTYTETIWANNINSMGTYMVPALGGIIYYGNWNNTAYIIPYSSSTFRIILDNNQEPGKLTPWASSWYGTDVSYGMTLMLDFEIWK